MTRVKYKYVALNFFYQTSASITSVKTVVLVLHKATLPIVSVLLLTPENTANKKVNIN